MVAKPSPRSWKCLRKSGGPGSKLLAGAHSGGCHACSSKSSSAGWFWTTTMKSACIPILVHVGVTDLDFVEVSDSSEHVAARAGSPEGFPSPDPVDSSAAFPTHKHLLQKCWKITFGCPLSTRIKDMGIATCHSRGYTFFFSAGCGNGLEGVVGDGKLVKGLKTRLRKTYFPSFFAGHKCWF